MSASYTDNATPTVQSYARQLNILTIQAAVINMCSAILPQEFVGSLLIDQLKKKNNPDV